jgi:import receptor subunit TOM70
MAADKVLTDLARRYIEALPPVRTKIFPFIFSIIFLKSTAELSKDYVRTSLNEFEDDPVLNPALINEIRTNQPDSPLARAYQAYDESRFTEIPLLCTQQLESSSNYRLETLLLRGSFYLLMGNFKEASADFDAVINDPNATEKV